MIELKQEGPFGEVGERIDETICMIAVGKAGINIVDQLVLERKAPEDLFCLDTDQQALAGSVVKNTFLVGSNTLYGYGAGGDPELAAKLIEKDFDLIKPRIEDFDSYIVVTGLGGGSGSGMTPVLVQQLKKLGKKVIVFALTPYDFEGRKRKQQAADAARSIYEKADALLLISNQRILVEKAENLDIRTEQHALNNLCSNAIVTVMNALTANGLMQIDINDLHKVTRCEGDEELGNENCWFGVGVAKGDNRIKDAVEDVINSPYFKDQTSQNLGKYIIVNIIGGSNMSMAEFQSVMETLNQELPYDLPVVSGAAIADGVQDYLQLSVIVTGYALKDISSNYAAGDIQKDLDLSLNEKANKQDSTLDALQNDELISELNSAKDNIEDGNSQVDKIDSNEADSNDLYDEELLEQKEAGEKLVNMDHLLKDEPLSNEQPLDELPLDVKIPSGRFAKSSPTIISGQNLDQPTFLRLNMKIKI